MRKSCCMKENSQANRKGESKKAGTMQETRKLQLQIVQRRHREDALSMKITFEAGCLGKPSLLSLLLLFPPHPLFPNTVSGIPLTIPSPTVLCPRYPCTRQAPSPLLCLIQICLLSEIVPNYRNCLKSFKKRKSTHPCTIFLLSPQ